MMPPTYDSRLGILSTLFVYFIQNVLRYDGTFLKFVGGDVVRRENVSGENHCVLNAIGQCAELFVRLLNLSSVSKEVCPIEWSSSDSASQSLQISVQLF
jgi:hypothetical protein